MTSDELETHFTETQKLLLKVLASLDNDGPLSDATLVLLRALSEAIAVETVRLQQLEETNEALKAAVNALMTQGQRRHWE